MNKLVTDIKSLELETLRNLRNSKSANTLRAYESDFEFLRFLNVSNSKLLMSVTNLFILISDNH